jgi:probable rRNA maturation factor
LIAAHSILDPPLMELSIALVADAQMCELHERYLKVTGPTDVLTFEVDENDEDHITSGEVVICVDEANRQALQRGSTTREELLLYALHGMLHLCGFDDRTPAGYRKMHRKEDEILTQLGVGPVFAAKPRRRLPARSEVE